VASGTLLFLFMGAAALPYRPSPLWRCCFGPTRSWPFCILATPASLLIGMIPAGPQVFSPAAGGPPRRQGKKKKKKKKKKLKYLVSNSGGDRPWWAFDNVA